MTTHFTRGEGKLYESRSGELLSSVSYQIHEELIEGGNHKKWSGELTLVENMRIPDGDRYVLELEDRRRGRCSLGRRVNKAVILVPARFFYFIQGTGPLK